jgi:polyisoprenoid-binding protein YceI
LLNGEPDGKRRDCNEDRQEKQMTTTSSAIDVSGDYVLDVAHTQLGFVARHAMVTKVRGRFREFEGSAHLDAAHPERSTASVVIEARSIDTGNADRDAHLRSNDFLDMEQYPHITFDSTAVEKVDDEHYRMTGDLTIKGTTCATTVDFVFTGIAIDPFGNVRAGFEGSCTLNRKDWGVAWNATLETGGMLVSDKVNLEIEVSAVKGQPTS